MNKKILLGLLLVVSLNLYCINDTTKVCMVGKNVVIVGIDSSKLIVKNGSLSFSESLIKGNIQFILNKDSILKK